MSTRIDHHQVNPAAVQALAATYQHLTTIPKNLRALVELRVSQINGCAFCVDMHSTQARAEGETVQRLDCLVAWRESPFFTPRERAALAWAEALTRVVETHAPDEAYQPLLEHFSEKEIVDLTWIISIMNTWNRLAIGMRKEPAPRS